PKGTAKVVFSDKRVSSRDSFFYHKTTNRKLYDGELRKWRKKGYFDAIFSNEKNQITEGAVSNIIIKKGRFYYTPPVSCGLLRGVYREYILKSRKIPLKEKILYKSDIRKADKIYMVNSVRGMVEAVL
ncbi:MAG TPA: aminodeoxychorismate synthase, component I, partial [Candidatus Omnitrophica bacterium]|nr:aminodeoxychorismate synthase, component I [Candidatus Omnitrophota bacterium]